jgi:hypothetical protein
VVLAGAGYWHMEQINAITGDGIPVLIPPDSSRRRHRPPRPGCEGSAYDFIRPVLATERGAELYTQRGVLIAPLFGNTKRTRMEWRVIATTHDLLKLHERVAAAVI